MIREPELNLHDIHGFCRTLGVTVVHGVRAFTPPPFKKVVKTHNGERCIFWTKHGNVCWDNFPTNLKCWTPDFSTHPKRWVFQKTWKTAVDVNSPSTLPLNLKPTIQLPQKMVLSYVFQGKKWGLARMLALSLFSRCFGEMSIRTLLTFTTCHWNPGRGKLASQNIPTNRKSEKITNLCVKRWRAAPFGSVPYQKTLVKWQCHLPMWKKCIFFHGVCKSDTFPEISMAGDPK